MRRKGCPSGWPAGGFATRGQKEVERLDLIGVGLPIIESAKSAADSRRGHGGADESASGEP